MNVYMCVCVYVSVQIESEMVINTRCNSFDTQCDYDVTTLMTVRRKHHIRLVFFLAIQWNFWYLSYNNAFENIEWIDYNETLTIFHSDELKLLIFILNVGSIMYLKWSDIISLVKRYFVAVNLQCADWIFF